MTHYEQSFYNRTGRRKWSRKGVHKKHLSLVLVQFLAENFICLFTFFVLQKEREKDCSSALLCLSVNNSRFRVIHTKSLVHLKKIIIETLLIILKRNFLSLRVSSTPFLAHKLSILGSLLDLFEKIDFSYCCSDQANSFDLGDHSYIR